MNIYGANDLTKVLINCIQANKKKVEDVYDYYGGTEYAEEKYSKRYDAGADLQDGFVVAERDNDKRRSYSLRLAHEIFTLVDPSAKIGYEVELGKGTVVLQNAVINPCAKIGKHVLIEAGAFIDCDCEIKDYSYIGPGAKIGARAIIESRVSVSAGAYIDSGVRVGQQTCVYPGTVVLHSVPDASFIHCSHES
jgi:acetyltransferase EpsM